MGRRPIPAANGPFAGRSGSRALFVATAGAATLAMAPFSARLAALPASAATMIRSPGSGAPGKGFTVVAGAGRSGGDGSGGRGAEAQDRMGRAGRPARSGGLRAAATRPATITPDAAPILLAQSLAGTTPSRRLPPPSTGLLRSLEAMLRVSGKLNQDLTRYQGPSQIW